MMIRRGTLLVVLGLGIGLVRSERSEGEKLYLEVVRPLLAQKCLACHGDKPAEIKGDLDIRTREGLLKGGESGAPAVVSGKPAESPMFIAVTWQDGDLEMPPKANDRLDAAQVEVLRKWIELGAPWAEDVVGAGEDPSDGAVRVKTSGGVSPEWTNRRYQPEDLWSYRSVEKPSVPLIEGATHLAVALRDRAGGGL